jgi:hypothetical protein
MLPEDKRRGARQRPKLRVRLEDVAYGAGLLLVMYFRPFSHLLGRDVQDWLELAFFIAAWVAVKIIYHFGIKRGEDQRVQLAALQEEIRSWRLKRISLLPRAALHIGVLALVILGF